jgi:hypothetical protein
MGAASRIPTRTTIVAASANTTRMNEAVCCYTGVTLFSLLAGSPPRVAAIRFSRALKQWLPAARSLFLPTICYVVRLSPFLFIQAW